MTTAAPLFAFFGHHKCATSWIDYILLDACRRMGRRLSIVHRPVDFAEEGALHHYVEARQPFFLAYTNARADDLAGLPPFRGFHVVRDPRDVIVSGYFSHRNTHPTDGWPELAEHRARLRRVSKEEGLVLEMDFSAERLGQMGAWNYALPHVMEWKMEDLTADPVAGFLAIFDFLGLLDGRPRSAPARAATAATAALNALSQRSRARLGLALPQIPLGGLPPEQVEAAVRRFGYEKLSGGRRQGQEDVRSHYRKGQPGDWRNHFTAAHADAFAERFGDLPRRLGYETDDNWHRRHAHPLV